MDFQGENLLISAKEEKGRICQFNIVREGEKKLLGNIYIGKVKNIKKNIHCALLRSLPERCAIIPWMKRSLRFLLIRKRIRS